MNEGHEIKRLTQDVINKIAAGEVVQRPGAALKEMMENSIDAHATNIVITLNRGGMKQMQIQDNGDGILKNDLPLLCERYTTSKLRELDDLNTIQTFGFRGEALASISTVSRVMVITKRESDVCGWKVRYNGNIVIDNKIEPTAATKGTSITVDDLFYNIPLRQNMYNKKESDETKFILTLVQIFSIYYCPKGISITLKESTNKTLFKSQPAKSLQDSISNVIGASIRNNLNEIQIEEEKDVECPFSATLLFSPKSPVAISPSLSFILFVNGRYIQNTRIRIGIRRVLEQYYYCSDTNSKSRNQNTFCFISLWIDSHLVDVNVHPNKREICFLDEDYVVKRIVDKVEEAVERIVNTQTIGEVGTSSHASKRIVLSQTPSKDVNSSPTVYANKKIRVDYSQRTLNFSSQSSPFSPSKLSNSQTFSQDLSEIEQVPSSIASQESIQSPSKGNTSILSDYINETPYKETREELQLDSVISFCDDIKHTGELCTHERDILQKSIFINCMKGCSLSLIQYENKLVLLQNESILEDFFYQLIVFNFGCFYNIRFYDNQIDIEEAIQTVMTMKKETRSLSKALEQLNTFAPMLKDYFSITIEKVENKLFLKSLPLLLIEYEPYYGYLPLFLYRLAFEVSYNDERHCLNDIAKEIACFYSYLPKNDNEEEKEKWKTIYQTVLYPQIKKQMIVCDRLWSNGSIQMIASTDRLYRVFERC